MLNKNKDPTSDELHYGYKRVGLVTHIYSGQKQRATEKGYVLPYTRDDLIYWVLTHSKFDKLYSDWVDSGFLSELRPSTDRIDDYKGYSFGNLHLVTWGENIIRAWADRKNGVNNKRSKTVIQFDKEGNFIKEYHSTMQVQRETGIPNQSISRVCNNKRYSAGGFVWKYKY